MYFCTLARKHTFCQIYVFLHKDQENYLSFCFVGLRLRRIVRRLLRQPPHALHGGGPDHRVRGGGGVRPAAGTKHIHEKININAKYKPWGDSSILSHPFFTRRAGVRSPPRVNQLWSPSPSYPASRSQRCVKGPERDGVRKKSEHPG